jgi:hypothetical protein
LIIVIREQIHKLPPAAHPKERRRGEKEGGRRPFSWRERERERERERKRMRERGSRWKSGSSQVKSSAELERDDIVDLKAKIFSLIFKN